MPEAFVCSITQRIMLDPVVAADGHTYERAAISRWFAEGRSELKSPLSGERLCTAELLPNKNLRSQIQNFSTTTDNGADGSALERENMRLLLERAETAADELREKLQARTCQRDGARAERDAARAERDAARAERDAVKRKAEKQSKRLVRCHALAMEAQKKMFLEKILKLSRRLGENAVKLNKAAATVALSPLISSPISPAGPVCGNPISTLQQLEALDHCIDISRAEFMLRFSPSRMKKKL